MKAVYAVKSIDNVTGKSESFIHMEDLNGLPHFIEIRASQWDKLRDINKRNGFETTTTKGGTFQKIYVNLLEG